MTYLGEVGGPNDKTQTGTFSLNPALWGKKVVTDSPRFDRFFDFGICLPFFEIHSAVPPRDTQIGTMDELPNLEFIQ